MTQIPTPRTEAEPRAARLSESGLQPRRSGGPGSSARRRDPADTASLVLAAAEGDATAWNELIDLFLPVLWATARRFRLGESDAADVVQTTWLRLIQHIHRIEDPARVGGWLVTTARHEAIRVSNLRKHMVPTEDALILDGPDPDAPSVSEGLLRAERDAIVRDLFDELPARQGELLRLLISDPPLSYLDISRRMDMPIGSIGPTRARCLRKLAAIAAQRGVQLESLAR